MSMTNEQVLGCISEILKMNEKLQKSMQEAGASEETIAVIKQWGDDYRGVLTEMLKELPGTRA